MKSVSFSIRRVNRLRRAAEKARQLAAAPDPLAETSPFSGRWSVSDGANDLIRVFDALRLKAGFALRAFVYREGANGNGIIWAVPADAPPVAADDCPRLEDTWLQPPQPPGGVPLMQAIEGDGSPWSYLSASILRREAAEFGAIWHGCVCIDPAPRGRGIRGNLARLRLERPDDSIQGPAAGGRPGWGGPRAETDRRRARQ